jgi:hypothetical protein
MEAVSIAGQFCGWVEKQQGQHLIHNLPLSAENIGCPIFDGDTVVAIHCGNVPLKPGQTVADPAKLALSINALRDLNLGHYRDEQPVTRLFNGIQVGAGFIVSFFCIAILLWISRSASSPDQNNKNSNSVTPVLVTFNKPVASYLPHDHALIDVIPHSDCYLTVIVSGGGGFDPVHGVKTPYSFYLLYPLDPDAEPKRIRSTEGLHLGQVPGHGLTVLPGSRSTIHIFACKEPRDLVKTSELDPTVLDKNEPRAITDKEFTLETVKNRLYTVDTERPDSRSGAEVVVDMPDSPH